MGKTTLLARLARQFSSLKISGFLTREIRERGKRVGFGVETFSGGKGILAHVNFASPFRVGKYFVNVNEFETLIIPELEKGLGEAELFLIDEIGKMELFSSYFREIIIKCLDSPIPCIATIMKTSEPFVDAIKRREDCRLFELTNFNRKKIKEMIEQKIMRKPEE